MKSTFQAATFFSILSSLFVFPFTKARPISYDITSVTGSISPESVVIRFQVPCPNFIDGEEDELDVDLEIDAANEECSGTLPRINGHSLVSPGSNHLEKGEFVTTTLLSRASSQQPVLGSWKTSCLKGEASILSFQLHQTANPDQIDHVCGFTASFRQKDQPVVIRLAGRPTEELDDEQLYEAWTRPEDHQKLTVKPSVVDLVSTEATTLQKEYEELEILKLHFGELHDRLHKTDARIISLLKEDFKSCNDLRCKVRTAMKKVPDFAHFIAAHFRSSQGSDDLLHQGCSSAGCQYTLSDAASVGVSFYRRPRYGVDKSHIDDLWSDFLDPEDLNTASEEEPQHQSFPSTPPSPSFPTQSQDNPEDLSLLITAPDIHGPAHLQEQSKILMVLAISLLISILLVSGLIIACLKRRISICCDPRRRADRAARREERQKKRAFHKAACRHKWRTRWNRLFSSRSTADYEEKREMILEQEGMSDDFIQDEISKLRKAHEIVDDLVKAEEGRGTRIYEADLSYPPIPSRTRTVDYDVRSNRTTETLPVYSGPPTYEQDFSEEFSVIHGFHSYTASISDETFESSVVDCSPRLSLDTGRGSSIREV